MYEIRYRVYPQIGERNPGSKRLSHYRIHDICITRDDDFDYGADTR